MEGDDIDRPLRKGDGTPDLRDAGAHALSARCFCGAAVLRLAAPAQGVVHCHYGQCRRLSGAAFTTWASFAHRTVDVITGEALAAFKATSNVTRHFCKFCGSHVFTSDARHPKLVGVPAGIVEGPRPASTAHYFVSHKAAWYAINDGLPQFGGGSGFAKLEE